jgi:hypothetical protein
MAGGICDAGEPRLVPFCKCLVDGFRERDQRLNNRPSCGYNSVEGGEFANWSTGSIMNSGVGRKLVEVLRKSVFELWWRDLNLVPLTL